MLLQANFSDIQLEAVTKIKQILHEKGVEVSVEIELAIAYEVRSAMDKSSNLAVECTCNSLIVETQDLPHKRFLKK